jgi:hypothetical protein
MVAEGSGRGSDAVAWLISVEPPQPTVRKSAAWIGMIARNQRLASEDTENV